MAGYGRRQQDQRNTCGSVLNGRSGPHVYQRYRGPMETIEAQASTKVRKNIIEMQIRVQTLERVRGTSSSETSKNRLRILFFFIVY